MVLLALAILGCAGKKAKVDVRGQSQSSFKLGMAYLREGRTTLALQEFSKAEALTPDDPEVLNALAQAYWVRREYALAIAKVKRATVLKPDYSEAWINLGAFLGEQGRYQEAVPAFENALKNLLYDTRELALANLGWALFKTGRVDEGEKRLREAVDIAPGFPVARKNLGIVLQEKGEHREALVQLNEAARLYPDDAETQLRRGLSLFKLGDREEARAAFDRAWHLAPGTEDGKSAKTYLDLLK
jgi:Tfp pilus assembly protein PilF